MALNDTLLFRVFRIGEMNDNASMSGGPGSGDKAANTAAGVGDAIFTGLVQAEDDTVGLLGYALFKQNKRDWLSTFLKEQGRDVTDGELLAYHLGERAPRRLLTYRRLAVDVLARDSGGRDGEGFAGNFAAVSGGGKAASPPSFTEAIIARPWAKSLVALLAAIGLLAIIVVALSAVSPSLVRDILPGQAVTAPK
jgi:hypothetical protein